MKIKLLLTLILVAVTSSVCAEDLTTMVGQVGASDNSSNAFADHSKNVVIKDGESYEYHLTNYNDGGNFYNNWIFEAFDSQNKYIDFRADGGYWGEAGTAKTFDGSDYNVVANWLSEYNGASATITITYKEGTMIIANNSKLSGGNDYNNKLTVTGLSGDLTMRFTNEKSHQIIDKVAHTKTNGVITTDLLATLDHTGAVQGGSNAPGSTLDAETHYYNNWGTSGWAAQAYIGFSYSIPEGATVTSATLDFYSNCGGSKDGRSVNVRALDGNSSSTFAWNSLALSAASGKDLGSRTDNRAIQKKTFDVTTIVGDNAPSEAIVFQLGGAAAGANLYGKASTTTPAPTLMITYTVSPGRTATFTEENSLAPDVKIYSNVARTEEVENGTLSDGVTYYYRAVKNGYYNYLGSFTVNGDAPAVNFTMIEYALPSFSLPANALYSKATVATGTVITDGIVRAGYNTTGVGAPVNNSATWTYGAGYTWYATFDVYRTDVSTSVNLKMYTSKGGESTSFQFDNGGVKYWTSSTTAYISNTAITPGKWYRVEVMSDLADVLSNGGNTMSVTITDLSNDTQFATKSGIGFRNGNAQWFLPTVGGMVDGVITNFYAYYIADITMSIPAGKYGTFCAPFDVTLPEGVMAFTAELNAAGTGVGLNEANLNEKVLPAGTPVIVKNNGDEAVNKTFNGKATVSEATCTSDGNSLVGILTNEGITVPAGAYIMLTSNEGVQQFHKLTSAGNGVLNRCYLSVGETQANVLRFDFDDETAINSIEANSTADVIYDLAGRKVMNAKKGLYIVNGKKVIR